MRNKRPSKSAEPKFFIRVPVLPIKSLLLVT